MTVRWPADPVHIARTVERLQAGAVIAFPTDTLYAVGCRARDPSAVRRLYAVKRRPQTQPVILLVAHQSQVDEWAAVTPEARTLMDRHWPGPLTLVLARRPGGPALGPGGPTLAFRVPNHPVALELLRGLQEPMASSSANRAGAPPPDHPDAVLGGLEHEIDLILDGGRTPLGKASTILDMSGPRPHLLRPGLIKKQELLGE